MYDPDGLSPHEDKIRLARERFIAWLLWFERVYPERVPTREALAAQIGITPGGLSQLLARDSVRMPSLPTLIGASEVMGFSVHQLLYTDPPSVPRGVK